MATRIDDQTKRAIKAVYTSRQPITTHNRDGLESPLAVLYRAAAVALRGGRPTNSDRQLPGGVTVGEVLRSAGIL